MAVCGCTCPHPPFQLSGSIAYRAYLKTNPQQTSEPQILGPEAEVRPPAKAQQLNQKFRTTPTWPQRSRPRNTIPGVGLPCTKGPSSLCSGDLPLPSATGFRQLGCFRLRRAPDPPLGLGKDSSLPQWICVDLSFCLAREHPVTAGVAGPQAQCDRQAVACSPSCASAWNRTHSLVRLQQRAWPHCWLSSLTRCQLAQLLLTGTCGWPHGCSPPGPQSKVQHLPPRVSGAQRPTWKPLVPQRAPCHQQPALSLVCVQAHQQGRKSTGSS